MKDNPFVLPGFGQSGPMGQNPMLASMEMMRQAWEGLASSGGMNASAMGRVMSVEEMDKRISDLRAVENWLRMNLSMLSSTIQGLEVQRATVATLKSFVDTGLASVTQPASGSAAGAQPRPASPLDEVLSMWPGEGRNTTEGAAAHAPDASKPAAASPGTAAADGPTADAPEQSDVVGAAASAAQGWWNLMQQQFQTLAAATAASAEEALADLTQAGKAAEAGAAKPAGTSTARKTPSKTAARTAAKKSTGRKTAAKSAKAAKSGRKAAAPRKTAR